MPTPENYIDPFECYSCGLLDSECICDEGDYDPSDIRRDSDEWECAFGTDCLNPHFNHLRSECYTSEMAHEQGRPVTELSAKLERLTKAAEKVYRLRAEAPAGDKFAEFYNALIMLGNALKANEDNA